LYIGILKVTNEKIRIRIRYSEIRIRTKMSQNRNTVFTQAFSSHFHCYLCRELEREEKKLEMEIKKAAKLGNKQVSYYHIT
jgi:hypothetical protein